MFIKVTIHFGYFYPAKQVENTTKENEQYSTMVTLTTEPTEMAVTQKKGVYLTDII